MERHETETRVSPLRVVLAALLPVLVAAVQWIFWGYLQPLVWFLLYPTVFAAPLVGGLWGGIAATAIAMLLGWFLFIPYTLSFELHNPASGISVLLFAIMGVVFSVFLERGRRLRAIAEQRRGDSHFKQLFDHMINGVAHCRMFFDNGRPSDFLYLDVNEAFEKLTGLKNVVGKRVSEVIPGIREADPQLFEVYGRVAMGQGPERFEIYVEALRNWFSISVYSPQPDHFVAVFDVVTERKHAEEVVERERARLQTILRTAVDGIHVLDTEGLLVEANPAFLNILGYDETAIGKAHVFDWEAQFDADTLKRRIGEVANSGDTIVFESRFLRSDGRYVDVEVSARGIDMEGRRLVYASTRDITERKRMEETLRKLSLAVEQSPESVVITDVDGSIEYVNEAFVRNTGYARYDVLGRNPRMLQSGKTPRATYAALWQALSQGRSWEGEFINRHKDGSEYIEFAAIAPIRESDGRITHYVAVQQDVTEKRKNEQVQARLNRALRLVSECNSVLVHAQSEQHLLDDICQLAVETGGYRMAWVGFPEDDADRTVRPVCHAGTDDGFLASRKFSWADTELGHGVVGTAIRSGTVQMNRDLLDESAAAPEQEAALHHGFRSNVALPLVSGQRVLGALAVYSSEPNVFSREEIQLLEELASDLAFGLEALRMRVERERAEERLEFFAHHDALTGLPNRLLLRDRFERAVLHAQRTHTAVALLFLDLDNFKHVNDSLGHEAGDRLLLDIVTRLRQCIRDTDTISRHGGDEFIILLTDLSDVGISGRIAEQILQTMTEPFNIDGHAITTSFSIGISLYPSDGSAFDDLLRQADTALYHAKDSGRNTYYFFAEKMNIDVLARMQLQNGLTAAVRNHELLLHYQPQVDLLTGHIVGVEALLRWQRPGEEMILPARFIPVAEQSGLIVPIGEWIIEEACRQAAEWRRAGLPELRISVNLSAIQFRRGKIAETVAAALERAKLPPQYLELELTESILLQETDAVLKVLRQLKALGVQLSIDDFGTGYSSLSYLKRLAVDHLKIDQSFVRNLTLDPDDAAIVKAIIQLGHSLQLPVIAEGVETDSQLAFLRRSGCDEIQGFFFSRPLPAADMESLLRKGQGLPPTEAGDGDEVRTILLVDDEENILAALRRVLRPDGYRILCATSAAAGLELLAKYKVGVIVSDQRMPGMSGVEFLRRAKAMHPESLRIVLSGYTDLKSITGAINEGAVYKFLSKPWDDGLLRTSIKDAFRQYELKQENERLTSELARR
jgi:diguanylate cyclase (GGDEF)-like protein/PAS domain S-box-containing protein